MAIPAHNILCILISPTHSLFADALELLLLEQNHLQIYRTTCDQYLAQPPDMSQRNLVILIIKEGVPEDQLRAITFQLYEQPNYIIISSENNEINIGQSSRATLTGLADLLIHITNLAN